MPPEPVITETTQHPDSKRHFHVRKSLILGLVVVGVLAVIAPLLIAQYRTLTAPVAEVPASSEEVVVAREPEVLGGKIYMSLAPVDADTHYALNVYSYDVLSGSLEQETDEDNREYLTSKISPDGTKMAFASLTNDGENVTSDTGLFVKDIETSELTEVEIREDSATKRNPTWSPDGKRIAFAALKDKEADALIPESWLIYVYTLGSSNTARYLTQGANPVFLPDGNLAVLKSNGIYYVSVQGGSEINVLPATTTLGTNMKFDISRDGTKIALGLPSANELLVIPVTSWAPFQAGDTTVIPASTFWPMFSPEGEYLAMQVFDWSDETEARVPVNQRLMIFSLRNNEWLNSLDLTPYHQDMLFITDWK